VAPYIPCMRQCFISFALFCIVLNGCVYIANMTNYAFSVISNTFSNCLSEILFVTVHTNHQYLRYFYIMLVRDWISNSWIRRFDLHGIGISVDTAVPFQHWFSSSLGLAIVLLRFLKFCCRSVSVGFCKKNRGFRFGFGFVCPVFPLSSMWYVYAAHCTSNLQQYVTYFCV